MKNSESKYYKTALLMDEALLILLEKKEFEFITVKEICEKAGVNRTTFYLHYESMEDLLMETIEMMYMTQLNVISKDKDSEHKVWFDNICVHFQKKLFPKKDKLTTTDYNKLKQYIAILFTIYDLYKKYNTTFKGRLKEECEKYGISVDAFLAFRAYYAEQINAFEQIVYKGEYEHIQNNRNFISG
jgi:AcrR family transcriptional regulator